MYNMNETWKDIECYEGAYQVSDLGRIKSLQRLVIRTDGKRLLVKETILKPSKRGSGYFSVVLYGNNLKKSYQVHRLVAFAFLEKTKNKTQVNHIDGIKTDNRLTNLEWCTPKENILHAKEIGLINNRGENHNQAKLTAKDVSKIKKLISSGHKGVDIAKMFSVSKSTVSSIKNRRNWSYTD